jgi:hypothetical protein
MVGRTLEEIIEKESERLEDWEYKVGIAANYGPTKDPKVSNWREFEIDGSEDEYRSRYRRKYE